MNCKSLQRSAKGIMSKVLFSLKKSSPELLLGTGIVGIVIAEIGIGMASSKVPTIKADTKKKLEEVHELIEEDTEGELNEKKELTKVYAESSVSYIKLYGPYVLLTIGSLGCIFAGHNVMRKRNMALTAAYITVDKGFKEYRERVADKFGSDIEKEIRYDIREELVQTSDEDGVITETPVKKMHIEEDSTYGRFFAEGNTGWSKNALYNRQFVMAQETYANQLLAANGHVFLNEIYRIFNMPETEAGQIVGWVRNKGIEPTVDISFGLYETCNESFMDGEERNAFLDFNVQGNILSALRNTKQAGNEALGEFILNN